ncbi:MAG TPA: class I SAM-dependent methyltransferase [Mobilitalea sp.]|nr:class I SAM-dependent methyltransferase [Mobilitalea sp.]
MKGCLFFYTSEKIEQQIINCSEPENILVLDCGTGLEVERIRHCATVTAIDISEEMLGELKKKQLQPQVRLIPILGSYFEYPFGKGTYDLVLSTYSLHHLTKEQKSLLYQKIFEGLWLLYQR